MNEFDLPGPAGPAIVDGYQGAVRVAEFVWPVFAFISNAIL
jgi:hypothetical protein